MKCPVCASTSIEKQAKFRAEHPCFSNLERVACVDCSLHFAHPMPALKELQAYNESYHDSAHGGSERNKKQKAFFLVLAKTRLNFIQNNISLSEFKHKNVLEIGPGPGSFVEVWKEKFPQSNYYALESDKSCHQSLLDLGVNILTEKELSTQTLKFDILILSHVLEHVTDPIAFLKPYIDKLNAGGHMFVEVPCLDWKHKNLEEPHLLFFDKPSMKILLERLKLQKVRIAYFGTQIKELLNPVKQFLKRLRRFLWRKGIVYYHPEKKILLKILGSKLEVEASISFSPHLEQAKHSWWLRIIAKKKCLSSPIKYFESFWIYNSA